jgi:hypothetical protein
MEAKESNMTTEKHEQSLIHCTLHQILLVWWNKGGRDRQACRTCGDGDTNFNEKKIIGKRSQIQMRW